MSLFFHCNIAELIVTFYLFVDLRTASEDSEPEIVEEFDEEVVLNYYFKRGFSYSEIIEFLAKHHNYHISNSTLLRKLKHYGLRRRNARMSEQKIIEVKRHIQDILNGPGSQGGYRSVWHDLELQGIRVPRLIVQELLREMDPDGVSSRKAHRLKRREYSNPGPNFAWHQDGYDKLKPFGFPMHGCIDGYSRRILWLWVSRSNNQPEIPGSHYLNTVCKLGGVPVELITDLGTENGLAASMQCYFRENADAHRYVPSPRNQRIESWWSFFCRNRIRWWINFFKDLESQGVIDTACELSKECMWFCFSGLLQSECDHVKEKWNTHYIRKSRHDTVSGRPDSLFFLPELHGGRDNLLLKVSSSEVNFISQQYLTSKDDDNEYQEYFRYLKETLDLTEPNTWEEALEMYNNFYRIADNGQSP